MPSAPCVGHSTPVWAFENPHFGSSAETRNDASPITDRELEVIQLMAEGLPKKNIADQLSISPNTVVTHVTHIYEKLDAQNAPSAIAKAFRMGILKMEAEE